MRWTLGLVCFVTACFGESATPNNTSADETSTSQTTTGATESATTSTSMTATPSTSGEVDTSGPPDVTESSAADTTTGDMCPPGTGPNPPVMPPWQGPVFVSMPSAEPMGCPRPMTVAAIGFVGLPPTLDECECRCTEPYVDLCDFEFRAGNGCPIDTLPTAIDAPCTELPSSTTALQVNADAASCDPEPLLPANDRVVVCEAEPGGPCIDLVDGMLGPCIFQDADADCPMGLERVEAGRTASCSACEACNITDFCGNAEVAVHAAADCGNAGVGVPFASCQQNLANAVSFTVSPSTEQTCESSGLTLDELTVCCPM